MSPIPTEIQDRRAVEDQAVQIADERAQLTDGMTRNTWAIIELLRDPRHSLIPLDHLANLLGVSRQSLYRWREIGQKIPADRTAVDWLSERDETGALVHYYG